MEPSYYNVNLNWVSDRKGKISSPELNTDIEVATPPEFPHGIAGLWSPEHLLTASVVSCFMTTFLAVSENSKLEFNSFKCGATGKLEAVEGKLQMTAIELKPILEISSDSDMTRAQRVLEKSEAACLISNSIKTKVTMTADISVSMVVGKL